MNKTGNSNHTAKICTVQKEEEEEKWKYICGIV